MEPMSALSRFKDSMSIFHLLPYLPPSQILSLQHLSNDFYTIIIPRALQSIPLAESIHSQAYMVFMGQRSYYRISAQGTHFKWEELASTFDKPQARGYPAMWPKIIQASRTCVYFLGGNKNDSLATNICFRLEDNIMREVTPLQEARYAFGACKINQKIYCVGGLTQHDNSLSSCEVYDIIEDKWSYIAQLEVSRFSLSLTSCPDKRYLLGFGGCEQEIMSNNSKVEVILRYDTFKQNWERIVIKHVLRPMACQYGLQYLSTDKQTHKYLIFGGITHHEDLLSRVMTISLDMVHIEKSTLSTVTLDGGMTEFNMPFEDRLYFNQSFKAQSDLVNTTFATNFKPGCTLDVYTGRLGLHIIDRKAWNTQSEYQSMYSTKIGAYRDLLMQVPTLQELTYEEYSQNDINEMIRQLSLIFGPDFRNFAQLHNLSNDNSNQQERRDQQDQ
ncbi:hypothetical protein FGO68_gene7362 [Halteria grandinella]|uniref:Kelch motif family protein n=1 Tax=Halteria grandinella TaxID=5974 RepID=A0A8J8NQR9_HALGN|nr:hypothetical protein FGO68_gene7362 [Halteria grandinella]